MECPDANALVAFVEGVASVAEVERLQAHLDGCPRCLETLSGFALGSTAPGVTEGTILPRGAVLGRYVVLHPIGRGAMSTVYVAYDPDLDRQIALKVVATGQGSRDVLLSEARHLARLEHPHVVRIYDAGLTGERMFIAMELVDVVPLLQWSLHAARGGRSIRELFRQAAEGLAAAHRVGIVHHDIKPDNVLVTPEGTALLGDFGLAVDVQVESTLPGGGTPAYLAPERMAGERGDERSDQYALCLCFLEAARGSRVPRGSAAIDAALRQLGDPILRRVLARGLAEEPAERFADVDALALALRGQPRRWLWPSVAGGLALVGAGAALLLSPGSEPVSDPCGPDPRWESAQGELVRPAVASVRDSEHPAAAALAAKYEQQVERYVQRWQQVQLSNCRARLVAGTRSDATYDRSLACLDRARIDAVAALRVAARLEGTREVEGALSSWVALPGPESCDRESILDTMVDPSGNDAEREQLAHIKALFNAGHFDEAWALLDEELEPEDPSLAIEHAYWRASVVLERSGDEVAEPLLEQILVEAGSIGRHDIELNVIASFLVMEARQQDVRRKVAIDRLIAFGDSALARAGDPPGLRATWWVNKASRSAALGGHEESIRLLQEALAIRERYYPEHEAKQLAVKYHLVSQLGSIGRLQEALVLAEEVLEGRRALYGNTHSKVAVALRMVGTLASALGKRERAETALREALALTESSWGPEHQRTAALLEALASVRSSRDLDEALALSLRALSIQERELGAEHIDVAFSLLTIGDLYNERDEPRRALEHLERALDMLVERLGEEHRYVAHALGASAWARCELGEHAEALGSYERVLELDVAVHGAEHWQRAQHEAWLAWCKASQGVGDEADVVARRALVTLESDPETPTNVLAEGRFILARILGADRRHRPEALALARQALETYDGQFPREEVEIGRWIDEHEPGEAGP